MNKNKLTKILTSATLFTAFVASSFAQSTALGDIKGPIPGNIFDFISKVSGYLRPLIVILFLFVIIYGGFVRMTAAGDAEKEKKSTSILTAGIVGFIIVVLAPVIVKIISALIGVQDSVL